MSDLVLYDVKDRVATQEAFGALLSAIASGAPDLAERIVTTSPDVSVSTNLGPWINKTGLFARDQAPDVFRDEDIASAQKWARGPGGRRGRRPGRGHRSSGRALHRSPGGGCQLSGAGDAAR